MHGNRSGSGGTVLRLGRDGSGRFPNGTMKSIPAKNMAQPARKKTGKMATKRTSRRGAVELQSKENAAGKLASMIEEHMSDLGLSEDEKNLRVARFAKRADLAIASHAKS